MAPTHDTRRLALTEEALTILFCLIDDAYTRLNPRAKSYESIKHLSDSEVIALALLQQSFGASKANAPSCGTPSGSSRTCSREWWGSTLPHSIGG